MTELIWEGKYDKDGNKVAPLRVKLPFQTVETVNETAKERNYAFDMFSTGHSPEWRNHLIWGDKKYVLPALLDEFAGKVDLIYIDPPFDTGADFSFQVQIGNEGFIKEPSIIEQKAYRDTWGVSSEEKASGKTHLDKYLEWFYETALFLNELLTETGSIYVHMDWHAGHYAKLVLDEVFGRENFRNEISWQKIRSSKAQSKAFGNVLDMILFYSKGDNYIFNQLYVPLAQERLDKHYNNFDEALQKHYQLCDFTQKGQGPPRIFGEKGELAPPPGKHWIWTQEKINDGIEKGLIVFTTGRMPRLKRYLEDSAGNPLEDLWNDISPINSMSDERVTYATQKPEALLERIITASSSENDLVLDCFIGSGTTAAVAEKLNRRWIAADLGRFAIHTTRKRLLEIPNVKPFVVQNLGKYERQLWQAAEFGDKAENKILAYRQFILELYHAQPITGHTWLHGLKGGRMVHVGAVDSPISPTDVTQIAAEFKRIIGTGKNAPTTNGIDVLGWEFAFEINEVAKQHAAQANINMRFLRIPREVLEKKAVEQNDIRFFELAALALDVQQNARNVTLTLNDFIIPPDDVREDVRKAITHWEQWIDYWAVDWNNREDTFHNEWQDYRTRKKREIQKTISHTYDQPGSYIIMVKVIDILGNDTTKTIKIEVH